ncbi:MAG: thioredoxin-disulfide reductase [Sulfurovum sp.]|nr:thioredoxin-disulfide reductase [Sulfurovum sp.]MCB4744050.1 thioredoxin-disulfide reductase [Sulfurovum sp.]MCB4746596.1 thioredoxin-disulfide reductase [Sulfurovum sp.]MCB4747529.1 thioredoxin-disulfide reductase [Sulfurovum sp.]MCB4749787.1 thioredoxin-disulfide reductase [Sulfurovum sp.]
MLDCAIIGGGPAGLTAGLYATRGGLKNVVLFEVGLPGGQITQSSEIENYPGFFDHTKTGMDFMNTWQEQCFHFGLKHEMQKVEQVTKEDTYFIITLENGSTIKSKTAIVCTGSIPKRAGFKGEDEFFGRGVSTCATCDGFFYKDKPVTVLGGGDTALEEAIYLSGIVSNVYLVHRNDTFSAAPSTIERIKNKENIHFILNSVVEEVLGDAAGVHSVRVKNLKTDERQVLDTPGLFVFVGHNVNNGVLKDKNAGFICDVNDWGQVVVDLGMKTSMEGLYVAGDLRIEAPKQVVVAAGDGATAALQVISYIQEQM